MAKILISTSALTKGNVSDLQTIHNQMVKLTERAETILKNANEVFPAAKSSWLRKLKSALGLLGVKDGQTLEDTIDVCNRLLSYSAETEQPKIENIKLGKDETVLDWAKSKGYSLSFHGTPIRVIGKQHTDLAVLEHGVHIGRIVKLLGKPYQFIPASFDVRNDHENLDIAL